MQGASFVSVKVRSEVGVIVFAGLSKVSVALVRLADPDSDSVGCVKVASELGPSDCVNWIVVPALTVFVSDRVVVKESGKFVAEWVRVGDCDGSVSDNSVGDGSVSEGDLEKLIFSWDTDSENVRGQIPGQK